MYNAFWVGVVFSYKCEVAIVGNSACMVCVYNTSVLLIILGFLEISATTEKKISNYYLSCVYNNIINNLLK